jgi:hypothetical protein
VNIKGGVFVPGPCVARVPEPGALERLLAEAYGHADAVQIVRTFEKYLTPTASRFWVLRPDPSHMPGM